MDERKNKKVGSTQFVDLGDDLLERTRVASASGGLEDSSDEIAWDSEERSSPGEIKLPDRGPLDDAQLADLMESAKILVSEGFLEDAKKLLRKVIICNPGFVPARKKLEEIHEEELRQILGSLELGAASQPAASVPVSSELLMRGLDRDLSLGVYDSSDGREEAREPLEALLAGDQSSVDEFSKRLEASLGGMTARDRMDLGVAFLEMELFELASRQFEAASRDLDLQPSAVALQATCLIEQGRSFEAILILEPMLADSDTGRPDKLEFMYLIGRAKERQDRTEDAAAWYRLVHEVDPYYRDTEERLRRILRGAAASD